MVNPVLTIVIILMITSCSHPINLSKKEKDRIIEEVEQTLTNYHNDIRKRGLHAEFIYLDSSSDFFWVPPGYHSAISYDSVSAILKQNAPRYRVIDNRFVVLKITPLTKDISTYSGQLRSQMTDTAGITTNSSLVETGTLIKRKDGWKLLSGQTAVID